MIGANLEIRPEVSSVDPPPWVLGSFDRRDKAEQPQRFLPEFNNLLPTLKPHLPSSKAQFCYFSLLKILSLPIDDQVSTVLFQFCRVFTISPTS